MTGVERIAAERKRQVTEEGATDEGDSGYADGELAAAGACYAIPRPDYHRIFGKSRFDGCCPLWPWNRIWWKPAAADRKRDLAKAGALIAAEIDRLQRIEDKAKGK